MTRRRGSELIPFHELCDDCVMPGELVTSDAEKAYRRGFHQGAALAELAFRSGAAPPEVRRWLVRVAAWRRKASRWVRGQLVRPDRPPESPGWHE